MALVVAFVLMNVALFSRVNALKTQDRVIRLEERLRMQALLPDELRPHINDVTTGQTVALRFASDEELPALVRKALDESAEGMSRALLKLSGSLVHDYATISDDSPSPNRASRARRAATSAGLS